MSQISSNVWIPLMAEGCPVLMEPIIADTDDLAMELAGQVAADLSEMAGVPIVCVGVLLDDSKQQILKVNHQIEQLKFALRAANQKTRELSHDLKAAVLLRDELIASHARTMQRANLVQALEAERVQPVTAA